MLGLIFTSQAGEIDPLKKDKKVTTAKKAVVVLDYVHWDFTGTDPLNPEHYERADQPANCQLGSQICQVQAPEDTDDPTGNTPDFSADAPGMSGTSVLSRINAAVSGSPNETATKKD